MWELLCVLGVLCVSALATLGIVIVVGAIRMMVFDDEELSGEEPQDGGP